MSRRNLSEKEVEEILLEDIPSGSESDIGDYFSDSDEDPTYVPEQEQILQNSDSHSDSDIDSISTCSSSDQVPIAVPASNTQIPVVLPQAPTWRRNLSIPSIPDFHENCGVSQHILEIDSPTPYSLFQLLFTNELVSHIAFHTNLYATQKGKPFTPVNEDEVRVFLGINLYMGIKKMPSYRDYWSTSPDLHDSYISPLMTVKRFSFILSHLHLNDNLMPKKGEPNFDKLYKIRPMLHMLERSFAACYLPHRNVAVDESMVKFKGRSSMKQYMKDKPVKRGYKIWNLCDQSFYNLKFQVYCGKTDSKPEFGLGGRVVTDLSEELRGKNHVVYMDNFFASVDLFLLLKGQNTFAVSTLNPNRKKLPKLKDEKTMKRGEFDSWACSQGISVYRWKDKRGVNLMSSVHDPSDVISVSRKEKDGTTVNVPCPKVLDDYNRNMNFVDNFDRLKADYEIDRKSKKWWHRLFFHFLDCCVVNAFIMHKELRIEKYCNKDFRRNVYQCLLAKQIVATRKSDSPRQKVTVAIKNHKPSVDGAIRFEANKHQPVKTTSRRCALCSTKARPIRTVWACDTCKVALCLKKKNCFITYHTK